MSQQREEYYKEYALKNQSKLKEYRKQWNKRNRDPEQEKLRQRKKELKRKYGITLEQYNQMFADQNGNCGICKRNQSEFTIALCVDHCHATGAVRGLLCMGCNTALGHLNDDPELVQSALNYLRK